jgi:exodeoxyribonuclease VII large subunit
MRPGALGLVSERRIYGVAELVAELNVLLDDHVGRIWIAGEVSNLRRPSSGHLYFTLKDEEAQLRAVLFRGAAQQLPFELEDGLEVLVFADVGVWAVRGDLQLVVRHLEPRGRGALQLAFEQLRRRLDREGLFDPARKRELPAFPRTVGIVTSPTAAALHDVIEVSGALLPSVPLLLAPARVQGEGAEAELVEALAQLASRPEVDVILLVRGGGSLEDLLPFNSEAVARAVVRSAVPVVTGIGHEIDVTIADLAADARAPTPSAAAARVVPDRRGVRDRLAGDRARSGQAVRARLATAAARLAARQEALLRASPRARLASQRARLERCRGRIETSLAVGFERQRGRLASLAGRLDSLSPLSVLGRGYAIVHRTRDGAVVRDPADVEPAEELRIRVARGEIEAQVRRVGTPPAKSRKYP